MNVKALITMLVLGSSTFALASTASAAPLRETTSQVAARDHRVETRPVVRDVRDHREPVRYERPVVVHPVLARPIYRPIVREHVYQPVYQTTYVQPVSPFVQGQLYLGLGGVAGTSIELTSNGGATYIQEVAVQYADGHSQLVQVGQSVDARNPSIQIPSDGCALSGLVIYGQGSGVSAIAV